MLPAEGAGRQGYRCLEVGSSPSEERKKCSSYVCTVGAGGAQKGEGLAWMEDRQWRQHAGKVLRSPEAETASVYIVLTMPSTLLSALQMLIHFNSPQLYKVNILPSSLHQWENEAQRSHRGFCFLDYLFWASLGRVKEGGGISQQCQVKLGCSFSKRILWAFTQDLIYSFDSLDSWFGLGNKRLDINEAQQAWWLWHRDTKRSKDHDTINNFLGTSFQNNE